MNFTLILFHIFHILINPYKTPFIMNKKRAVQIISFMLLACFLCACATTGHKSKRVKCPPHSSLSVQTDYQVC